MVRTELTTEDNIKIAGNYFSGPKDDSPAVILLHMMPATKESWNEFAALLAVKGFQVLAIDERGHGESRQGGKLNYEEFTNEQQQEKIKDVNAARDFFRNKDIQLKNIFVGGASIGANLTIQYLAENFEARAGFAISPGYNYKGIITTDLIGNMHGGQALFLAAAKDDPSVPSSWETVEELYKMAPGEKEARVFHNGGHGTYIFKEHPELMEELADWMVRHV